MLTSGVIHLPARDEHRIGVAKRARDEEPLGLREEADALGWSSSVQERSLALRRRSCPASSPSNLSCGPAAAATGTAEEHGCRREEAVTPEEVGAGAEAKETAMVDRFAAYLCNRDGVGFDPPPMATPLLPLCAFVTDFLKARKDGRVSKRALDGDLLVLREEADARGWSSAVPERSFAPRRRRSPASISSRRGCGWVAETADEIGGRPEEVATPDAVGSGPASPTFA